MNVPGSSTHVTECQLSIARTEHPMLSTFRPRRKLFVVLALTLCTQRISAQGQSPDHPAAQREMARRVPVTIAMVDTLPASGPVVVLRRAHGQDRELVLVG